MSKKVQFLLAIAALAFASASSAGASQRDNAIVQPGVAPIAALAGEFRPASDVIPSDLGTPSAGNGEQHIAKTGLFSSIKNAAKKVAKKVAGAAKTVAKKIAGPIKKAVTTTKCNLVPLSCKPKRPGRI